MRWDDDTIRDVASQFVQDEVFGSHSHLFAKSGQLFGIGKRVGNKAHSAKKLGYEKQLSLDLARRSCRASP